LLARLSASRWAIYQHSSVEAHSMKSQLKALFKALPVVGKIMWVALGGLPILVGVLGIGYTFYWELTPEAWHWAAFPPDIKGFLSNLFYGLLITAVCGVVGAFRLRKQRRQERLVQFGQRIDPPITKIEESLLRGGHGERFYYIYSHWHDPATGKKHIFESERLDFDPSTHLRQGDTLPIYFEPNDVEGYYFDVSSLPKPKRLFGN
jgi:hypothetical protein